MGWIGLGWIDFKKIVGWVQGICDGWVHYSVMLFFTNSKIMQCKHLTYIYCIGNGMRIHGKPILPYYHTEDISEAEVHIHRQTEVLKYIL